MFEPYRQLFLDNMQDSMDVSEVFANGEVDAFMTAIAGKEIVHIVINRHVYIE